MNKEINNRNLKKPTSITPSGFFGHSNKNIVELENFLTEEEAERCLKNSKNECDNIIANANKQAIKILDDSRTSALNERNEIILSGHKQIEQEINKVKMQLQKDMAKLIIQGAEKILAKNINQKDHSVILDNFIKKL